MKTPSNQTAFEGAPDKANRSIAASSLPSPDSVLAKILNALQSGQRLTSGEVWRRFGYSRLAAAVHRLRTVYGIEIASTEIEVKTADGRIAHVAEYWQINDTAGECS